MTGNTTRRKFLEISVKGAGSLFFLPFSGCSSTKGSGREATPVPREGYPSVEASGSYREIGQRIGSAMRERITDYFSASRDYSGCVDFLARPGAGALQSMLNHTRDRFPHLIEELEGMAEGLDMPFMNLLAYNCRSEIGLLSNTPGCSTLAFREGGRMILAHNEDGDDRNAGRMFVARVAPPSGVRFTSFVYPGLVPGNGPGFNDRGLVQTTNYLQPKRVADGVPRYFIARAIMEAKSLDEAVAIATRKGRAFPWHYNLASLSEGRILSVETFPGRHHVKEIVGFAIHTNHLLHPEMATDRPEDQDVPYASSLTRMRVLSRKVSETGVPASAEEMMKLLSLHEGRPYSPCRHPEGDIHGMTLGTAVFQAPRVAMNLFHGNPCLGIMKEYGY